MFWFQPRAGRARQCQSCSSKFWFCSALLLCAVISPCTPPHSGRLLGLLLATWKHGAPLCLGASIRLHPHPNVWQFGWWYTQLGAELPLSVQYFPAPEIDTLFSEYSGKRSVVVYQLKWWLTLKIFGWDPYWAQEKLREHQLCLAVRAPDSCTAGMVVRQLAGKLS